MSQLGLFGAPIEKPIVHVFFDTETTGLPLNWNAPASDVANWPRLVQLAWSVYENGAHVVSYDVIIKPEGYTIPEDSSAIHGITHQRALEQGIPIQDALQQFGQTITNANFVVAHNMSFDEKIIGAEFIRNEMLNVLASKEMLCTKELSTNFCAIANTSGRGSYKWPKLSELYMKLFGTEFNDAHNARNDVDATAKCFWEMKKRGVI